MDNQKQNIQDRVQKIISKDEKNYQKPEIKKLDLTKYPFFQNNNSGSHQSTSKIENNISESKTKEDIINNLNMPKKDRRKAIFEISKPLDENINRNILQYPKLSMNPNKCKIVLFIGDYQEAFINTLINIYTDINYKDEYRYKYKLDNNKLNSELRTYDIESISNGKDIYIISFPSFNKVEELFDNNVMKKFNDLVKDKSIQRINYIIITMEKIKTMNKKQLILFIYLINLFSEDILKKKIIILFASDKNSYQIDNINTINELFLDLNDSFLSEENFGFNFNSLFTPECFYINNKIIFEKNNNSEEEAEWNALSEIIKKIQNKISISTPQFFNNSNNISLIYKLIQPNNKGITTNIPELRKIDKKKGQFLLLYYLINSNIKNDISYIITYLLENLNDKIIINKGMKEINSEKFTIKYIYIYILSLSKIAFNNLQNINLTECSLDDQIIDKIQNIFIPKLISINLSKNNLTDLQIFSSENIFNNLSDLDLSFNNIKIIDSLIIGKFPGLKYLNLSHNKISNIKCTDSELSFNSLEKLDLSFNYIKELNKINIPSLKFINITNNLLSEGLINFTDISYGANELIIKKNNNELDFNYSKYDSEKEKAIVSIKFKYIIKNKDTIDILEKINLKDINKLILEGFENIEFLVNNSLNILTELDLKNNSMKDISVLNKVKFINLKNLLINENTIFEKGLSSLKNFNNINIELINIEYKEVKYIIRVKYNKHHKMNFTFDDLSFIKEEIFLKANKIDIEKSIWNDNINFFLEGIKHARNYPFFKIKPTKLTINFEKDKYNVLFDFEKYDSFYSNLNMNFTSNDLNIFNFEFLYELKTIEILNAKFNDNIDLSLASIPHLEKIILKNNCIESIKIISTMIEIKKNNIIIESNENKCDTKIFEFFDEQVLIESIKYQSQHNNKCLINYLYPFIFDMYIDTKKLNDIKSFKFCKEIILNEAGLTDDDIKFTQHETLLDLQRLSLDKNKITNIDFLLKIKSKELNYVSIKNNMINKGLKYIDENLFSQKMHNIEFKTNPENKDILILSLFYKGKYDLYFDYFYESDNNLEILKEMNLENISFLDLSNLNLKNIDFLSNKFLINLEQLNLNKNQIEDISVLSDVHFINIKFLSIMENPIKKGIFKNNFFKQSKYINISISKKENEYKILAKSINPDSKIEFFINDVEEIKDIFNFETSIIHLNRNKTEINQSPKIEQILYDKIKNIINELQNHDIINNINYNYTTSQNKNIYDDIPEIDYSKENYYSPFIIIDNGTSTCKFGLSNEEIPRDEIQTCVGYNKYIGSYGDKKEFFCGNELNGKYYLNINYPIEKGIINNWDDMEKIWGHIFVENLRVNPEERYIILTEARFNSKEDREKMAQIIFETFNVAGLYIAKQEVLSLYSAGKYTGIAIDSGEDITSFVPIFDGYAIKHAINHIDFGGRDLTNYMMELLYKIRYKFSKTTEKQLFQKIKENYCYVALDYQEELKSVEPIEYVLPDNTKVFIKEERIRCSEFLFGNFQIRYACLNSIEKCDIDIRKDLFNNIVLSGGNSMYKGLKERFTHDLKYFSRESEKEEIKVIALPERKYASWIGATILSTYSSFKNMWINKNEYDEYGCNLIHRKFF